MKVLKSSFIQSVSLVKSEGEATSLFKLIKSAAQDVLKEALCLQPNRNLFLFGSKNRNKFKKGLKVFPHTRV